MRTLKKVLSATLLSLGLIVGLASCVANKPTKNTADLRNTGKAVKMQKAFWLQYAVKINIQSGKDRVWQVLTDGDRYTVWNSTLKEFDGKIALKEKLSLVAYVDTTRTFTPKVKVLEPQTTMVWADGPSGIFHGERLYQLIPQKDGSVDFLMTEVFAGYAVAFAKKKLPDFAPAFEAFAADLKKECEQGE